MQYGQLGNSDLKVSRIGMGCVTFGREINEATSFAVADQAYEQGITFFDTADCYAEGASENVLGKWMRDRGVRDNIVLATKVGGPMGDDPEKKGCSPKHIARSVDESLQRLGVDHIDLYMVHCWDPGVPPLETLQALSKAVDQGKVRYLGCSNYAAWQLCRMLWLAEVNKLPKMQAVQPPYSLVQREIENEMLPLCADQDVGVIAYSPLGAGFLTGKYRKGQPIPAGTRFDVRPGHQPKYLHKAGFRVVDSLSATSEQMQIPMIHLALAWALSRPTVACTLIGARNIDQVDQAFKAWTLCTTTEVCDVLNVIGTAKSGA